MMKRTLAAMAAAMLLAGVLSGCSGSVYYEDPWNEGNVSTTRRWPGQRHQPRSGAGNVPQHTTPDGPRPSNANTGRVTTPSTNTNRVTTPNANTGRDMTPNTSTGMTGGR